MGVFTGELQRTIVEAIALYRQLGNRPNDAVNSRLTSKVLPTSNGWLLLLLIRFVVSVVPGN
jgi:hypothetical protein